MTLEFTEFRVTTRVVAGWDLTASLDVELTRAGLERGLAVTDPGVRPLAERLLSAAPHHLIGLHDAVTPNSEVGQVERLAERARETDARFLLAVGGGSVIDTAKAAAIVLTEGGRLLDHQGVNVLTRPLFPVVAVPTTAGTGSEVTCYAVIRDASAAAKVIFTSEWLAPVLAILDPALTLGLPPALTASTGMDALTHAVEAYLSNRAGPFSDALALAALETIYRHLPPAVRDGSDREARWHLLISSCQAGMAISWAMLGCAHALAHACGGLRQVPHGVANAILLPHCLAYNRPAVEARWWTLADVMGADPVKGVAALARRIGLPERLREVGVAESDLGPLAEAAILDGSIFTNPREATVEELAQILRAAY